MEEGSHSIVSHYDILGAPADADYAEIKSKYRAAILALHPDKLFSTTEAQPLKALNSASNDCCRVVSSEHNGISPNKLNATIKNLDGEEFQINSSAVSNAGNFPTDKEDSLPSSFWRVQKAWEVLRDPESRVEYDNFLRMERLGHEMMSTRIMGDEIHLGEMDCYRMDLDHGQEVEYSYSCRCGDLIVVSQEELQIAGLEFGEHASEEACRGIRARSESHRPRSNSLLLPCQSCSMHVRLIFS